MNTRADVTAKGAILLGRYVACDAFERSRPLRVVTHAHADHVIGLEQSLSFCQSVIMTKATKDMVEILRGCVFMRVKGLKR